MTRRLGRQIGGSTCGSPGSKHTRMNGVAANGMRGARGRTDPTMKRTFDRTVLVLATSVLAFACNKSPEQTSTAPSASAPSPVKPAPVASAPAVAAPFEGEILVAVKDEASKQLPPTITYDVKGNKVRYTPAAAPVHAVGDLDAARVYAVDDAKKSYQAIDLKAPANAKPVSAPKIQKTGKMEKLAGLDCENWTIDDGTEKVDVCASKGIAYFDLASDAKAGSAEIPWAMALTTEKAFPLRVVVHDKAGKEEYRAEATRADRRKVDDAIFVMPSGYKAADLAKETKTASLP
jgi:hypothetical protein